MSSQTTPEPKHKTRRSVACKSCHGLKVKCTPLDENDPSGPCVRCVNSKRVCEIDLNQPRKRRRREKVDHHHESPSSLSSELFKDQIIKNLQDQIASLQNFHQNSGTIPPVAGHTINNLSADPSVGSPVFVSKKDLEAEIMTLCEGGTSLSDLTARLNACSDRRLLLLNTDHNIDLVSKGILSISEAQVRLDMYKTKIYQPHPLIEIQETSAETLRTTQPFLFNAVMAVSNVVWESKTQEDEDKGIILDNEAAKSVALEVMVVGTKSVELIKSIVLLCLWYNAPELFKNRRYHLFNNISVCLLHDVGIISRPSYSFNSQDDMITIDDKAGFDPEHASLILILYFTTVSFCLILRRSIYVKWTPFVDECCYKLENSGVPRYEHIASFSRLSHQLERIHNIFHCPESKGKDFTPNRYVVTEVLKNLMMIRQNLDKDNHAVIAFYHSVEAYVHEPSLGSFLQDENAVLSPQAVQAIAKCTASCTLAVDECNKLLLQELSALPLFFPARIIYTAGILLRLRYFITAQPTHIDKNLVPKEVIMAIKKLNTQLERSTQLFPCNNYLKRFGLIIQLFIQTYATQVQELLKKSDGETPKQFAPVNVFRIPKGEINEVQKLNALWNKTSNNGLITNESGQPFGSLFPLDILSLAASYSRDATRPDAKRKISTPGSHGKPMSPWAGQFPEIPLEHGTQSPNAFAKHLARPDLLESSYMVLNDEFWGNLLRNDDDKINFKANAPAFPGEVFTS